MIKYYTIKECFDTCRDDDIPFIANVYNVGNHRRTKKELSELRSPISPDIACSDKWQIKRVAPKVLNSRDALEKSSHIQPFAQQEFIEGFEIGDKNGQLREWLKPEQVELREAVEEIICFTYAWSDGKRLTEALENLKPPYEL